MDGITLNELGSLGEFIGAIAVVFSLIFVGIQLRGNSMETRAATSNAASAAMSTWYTALGTEEQSSALFWNFMADPDALTPEQRFQVIMLLHGALVCFQNSYYLAGEGVLSKEILGSILESIVVVKDQPGWKLYWSQRRAFFMTEFQAYVDSLMASERNTSEGIYKAVTES
jgi:hypothetical protein